MSYIDEVYKLMGTTNQSISYWRNNPTKTSTLNRNKYEVILKAGKLFGLDLYEQELLANMAGLSLQQPMTGIPTPTKHENVMVS